MLMETTTIILIGDFRKRVHHGSLPVLAPKFKRVFRKFVSRNRILQKRIEDTLEQMNKDVFAAHLGTHKLGGELSGFICLYMRV